MLHWILLKPTAGRLHLIARRHVDGASPAVLRLVVSGLSAYLPISAVYLALALSATAAGSHPSPQGSKQMYASSATPLTMLRASRSWHSPGSDLPDCPIAVCNRLPRQGG